MQFRHTYIISGWEGSATDAWVWADALAKGFSVPEGFYYLADAGYPHCKELIFLFMVFGIIFRSGVLQAFGMYSLFFLFLIDLIFFKIIEQPNKCKGTIQPLSCSGMQCH